MNGRPRRSVVIAFVAALSVTGCAFNPPTAVFDSGSALETRSYQTRVLQGTNPDLVMRAVVGTLQDLGFVLDSADATLGTVSATKLSYYEIRLTVSVRSHGDQDVQVRANAQYSEPVAGRVATPIDDPATYQDFFAALERSVFLSTGLAR